MVDADADIARELAHLSRALKAPRLLASAQRLGPIAREAGWSHEQYLTAVLSQEVSSREASGALIRVKAAGFDNLKSLEDSITISNPPHPAMLLPTWPPAPICMKDATLFS